MKRAMIIMQIIAIVLATVPAHAQFFSSSKGGKITTQADATLSTTAAVVAAANPDRKVLNCTNNDGSIAVRWGDANTTASRGQRLAAGASIAIENIAAVYMAAESGAPVVSCTEEE